MGESSTSPRRRSRPSPPSARASSTSASPGSASGRSEPPLLGLTQIRSLVARHGIRPSKSLGQHFLTDPNLASAIADDAGAGAGVAIVEVGAGLGSLTVALAHAGSNVLAIEFDRGVVAALHDVVDGMPNVTILQADALRVDWRATLGRRVWRMAANLPYNVAVPLLLRMLGDAPGVRSYVVMVQQEVAERLAAGPGSRAYGAVSVKVAYHAELSILRRVPPEVFWPRPAIESSVLRLTPRPSGVGMESAELFGVIDASFGERRKTMRNAMRRLGLGAADAERVLRDADLDPSVRAERLALEDFARLTRVLVRDGVAVPR